MKKTTHLLTLIITSTLLISCGSDNGPKRIVIGTGNDMYEDNDVQYSLPMVVQVTRDDEHAAANVLVKLTAHPVSYFKGTWIEYDSDADGTPDIWWPDADTTSTTLQDFECASEDANHNSYLEVGEDINGNGTLEPTHTSTINAHPSLTPTVVSTTGQLVTDSTGNGYFVLTYPKSEALWSRVEVSAEVSVDGTEDTETYTLILPVLRDDVTDLTIAPPGGFSGHVGPYGAVNNCANPL
jgi:hypothetical protein